MKQPLLSVYDLVHYLKQTLDHDPNLQTLLIQGEISNFTNHRSGHWYFTLKDKKAKISCVLFYFIKRRYEGHRQSGSFNV